MGNVVKMQNIDKSSGKIRMHWDGKDTDGRIVGAGTYCMELNIVNQNANSDLKLDLPEHIMIGVKR
jgi:flagellar hook assembly protein FlgD